MSNTQLLINQLQDVSTRGSLSTAYSLVSSWQRSLGQNILQLLYQCNYEPLQHYQSLVTCSGGYRGVGVPSMEPRLEGWQKIVVSLPGCLWPPLLYWLPLHLMFCVPCMKYNAILPIVLLHSSPVSIQSLLQRPICFPNEHMVTISARHLIDNTFSPQFSGRHLDLH